MMVAPPARSSGRNPKTDDPRRKASRDGDLARTALIVVFAVALLSSVGLSAANVRGEPTRVDVAQTPVRTVATSLTAGAPVTSVIIPAGDRTDTTQATLPSVPTCTTERAQSPVFRYSVSIIDGGLEKEMRDTGMWSELVPVALRDLRVLQVTYWGFDGRVHSGRLVVNQAWTSGLAAVFGRLFDAKFPIRRMDPVDHLGMDGAGLVASDDTMSFNGRKMRGGSKWSMHAYGLAVDIDPAENPYVKGKTIIPEQSGVYVDRSREDPGVLHPGDVVVKAFAAIGWKWGASWETPKDYMHFSSNGK